MKKKVFGRKLSRGRKSREALFFSLIRAFVLSGKMTTTKAKAKAIQSEIDKLVTKAKKNTLSDRRRVGSFFRNDRKLVDLFFKIALSTPRKSGFTRITKLVSRRGDRAEMVILEWVDKIDLSGPKPAKKVKKVKVPKKIKPTKVSKTNKSKDKK